MITAQELRIGNWILAPNGKPQKVTGHLLHLMEDGDVTVSPIPLTPELLIKAGFYEKGSGFEHEDFIVTVVFGWYETVAVLVYEQLICNLQYLHEIQNLIHSLNYLHPKELQIQL